MRVLLAAGLLTLLAACGRAGDAPATGACPPDGAAAAPGAEARLAALRDLAAPRLADDPPSPDRMVASEAAARRLVAEMDDALPTLLALLGDPAVDDEVCVGLAEAFTQVGEDALAPLVERVGGADADVGAHAARVLHAMGRVPAVERVVPEPIPWSSARHRREDLAVGIGPLVAARHDAASADGRARLEALLVSLPRRARGPDTEAVLIAAARGHALLVVRAQARRALVELGSGATDAAEETLLWISEHADSTFERKQAAQDLRRLRAARTWHAPGAWCGTAQSAGPTQPAFRLRVGEVPPVILGPDGKPARVRSAEPGGR